MSTKPDGSYECDRCGADCGNGGVVEALVVSDLDFSIDGDENTGHVRNLHFCRDEREDGKVKKKGCASKVISAKNIEYYLERRRKEESDDSAEASERDPDSTEGKGDADPAGQPEAR